MKTNSLGLLSLGLALGASTLATLPAQAHIDMVGALESRGGNMKTGPCGSAQRGDGPVYTFAPGTTITLGVNESIAHDGYFRISFDDDGDDDFVDPASIDPINPNRYGTGKKCSEDAADRCGSSDFCSVGSTDGGPTVLWDNLDPHMPASLVGSKQWSWNIKLPDVECDNCTLQVMQVMEDPLGGAHGPFDGKADLYYRCIDIKLVKGAKNGAGATTEDVSNDGIECAKKAPPSEPEQQSDGGVASPDNEQPSERDAAVPGADDDDVASEEEADAPATGSKADAGKAPVKKDASTRSDDDDDVMSTGSDEGGCALAAGSTGLHGHAWALLALAAGLVARRRKTRAR